MSEDDEQRYDGNQIRRIAFPTWERGPDGAWMREWEIKFKRRIDDAARSALTRLSDETMTIDAVVGDDDRSARLRTTTRADAFSDEVFFWASYRLLERVNDEIGELELIQGQPRDWWLPFRPEWHQ